MLGGFFSLILASLAILRISRGGVGVSDLAIFHSAFLMTFQERFYFTYLHPEGCLFYQHFDPIVMVLMPFYGILGKHAWCILPISQALAFGLGFPALYRIARSDGLGNKATIFLLCLLFLNPAIHNILMYDFHPFVFCFPLLLWGWTFLSEGRRLLGFLCWGLAILCKENVALSVAVLGLAFYLEKRCLEGLVWTVVGLFSFVLIIAVIIPSFREVGKGNIYLVRYGWLGSSFGEIINTLLFRPNYVVKELMSDLSRWTFLGKMLLPLGLLPILAPRRIIAAIPELAVLMLSTFPHMYTIKFHYPAALSAVLFIAASGGLSTLLSPSNDGNKEFQWSNPLSLPTIWRRRVAIVMCVIAVIFTLRTLYRDDRAFPIKSKRRKHYYQREERRETIMLMANLIPSESTVSLPLNLLNPIFPFVERPLIAFLPDRADIAEYVIFDLRTRFFGGHKEEGLDDLVTRFRKSPIHKVIFDSEGFIVFKRTDSHRQSAWEKRNIWGKRMEEKKRHNNYSTQSNRQCAKVFEDVQFGDHGRP